MIELTLDILTRLQTPCYVYDVALVESAHRSLERALGTGVVLSLKANSEPELCRRSAHVFRSGVEVASLKELELARRLYRLPIYVNTPSLDSELCGAGIAAQATVVLDNLEQCDVLLASRSDAPFPPVFLRLNAAELSALGGRGVAQPADHFGMDLTTALTAADRLRQSGVRICGIHAFRGSNSWPPPEAYAIGAARAVKVLEATLGYELRFLNLGGGFPSHELGDRQVSEYRDQLRTHLSDRSVLHEAGRGIFAHAGAFVVRALAFKTVAGRSYIVCDGGLPQNFLLCQTERALKQPAIPRHYFMGPRSGVVDGAVDLVGPSCNRSDRIGQIPRGSPVPQPGDWYVFDKCGAYNAVYSPSLFLGMRPATVHVMDSRC